MRNWLARKILFWALKHLKPQPRIEGKLAVTIFETLADLESRLAKVEAAPGVDTSAFATASDLTAVSSRVTVLESEVGTPPADPAQG